MTDWAEQLEREDREARSKAELRAIEKRLNELDETQRLSHAREFESLSERHLILCSISSFAVLGLVLFDGASQHGIQVAGIQINSSNLNLAVAALGMASVYSMHRHWVYGSRSEALYPLDILLFKAAQNATWSALLAALVGHFIQFAKLFTFSFSLLFSAPQILGVGLAVYERSGAAAFVESLPSRMAQDTSTNGQGEKAP